MGLWQLRSVKGLALLSLLALLTACAWPTRDESKIKAIKEESLALMVLHPPAPMEEVPKGEWGPTIAGLKPEIVWVGEDGVDILVKPDFDGGWGYFVPRDERNLVDNPCRFSAIGQGVY